MMKERLFGWALAGALVSSVVPAAERHPFTLEDLLAMQRVSNPVASPDGRWIAFELRTYTLEANRGNADVWVVSSDGATLRQLTTNDAQDSGPAWSPDSTRLAFLSTRSGASQIWSIPVDGGEAVRLAELPLEVDAVRWSPEGGRLAFSMAVYPDCDDLACTVKRDKEKETSKLQARLYDDLMIRHWDQWEDGKRNHLFVMPVGGAPLDVTRGLDADAPTLPFGGVEEFTWTPKGDGLIYTAKAGPDRERTTDLNLFHVSAKGGPAEPWTDNPALDTNPSFSPDGRTLAYLAMSRAGYEADRQEVILRDVASGKKRSLTAAWDRSVAAFSWSPDSTAIYALAEDEGTQPIFRIDARDGKATRVVAGAFQSALQVLRDGRLAFTRDSFVAPAEIWTAGRDGSSPRALTHFNDQRLAQTELASPEEFWFPGAGGDRVHGFLFKPAGLAPGKKAPLVYFIHGGPQGSFSDHFHYRWNPQPFTGHGYAVATVDFHGSTGYGQAFTDAIRNDWGGKPFQDIMLGLDHLLAGNDWIDGTRVAAAGASYGGYMVNWLAGHTDRFRCLVNHDGLFSLKSMYYTTEELWFPEWEFGGTPWEAAESYKRWDPSESVGNWKTPMLVIHGGNDYRVADTEGLSTFTALQRRGIASQLLYLPDEGHWVTKPQNSKKWHATVLEWLDRFLK
jgi:dipeptidyl aminopeptidase/acylaminoacyl peptidase